MNERQMQAFLAVAAELDYGRAARRLRITTGDLLNELERLEDHLGCSLVRERTGRLVLTGHGVVLLPKAEAILASDGAREAVVEALAGERSQRLLRVACTPETCWDGPLRRAQEGYFHQGSVRRLRVAVLPREQILSRIRGRKADLGLVEEVDLVCRIDFHVRRIQIKTTRNGGGGGRERRLVRYAVWRHRSVLADFLSEWVDGLERSGTG